MEERHGGAIPSRTRCCRGLSLCSCHGTHIVRIFPLPCSLLLPWQSLCLLSASPNRPQPDPYLFWRLLLGPACYCLLCLLPACSTRSQLADACSIRSLPSFLPSNCAMDTHPFGSARERARKRARTRQRARERMGVRVRAWETARVSLRV